MLTRGRYFSSRSSHAVIQARRDNLFLSCQGAFCPTSVEEPAVLCWCSATCVAVAAGYVWQPAAAPSTLGVVILSAAMRNSFCKKLSGYDDDCRIRFVTCRIRKPVRCARSQGCAFASTPFFERFMLCDASFAAALLNGICVRCCARTCTRASLPWAHLHINACTAVYLCSPLNMHSKHAGRLKIGDLRCSTHSTWLLQPRHLRSTMLHLKGLWCPKRGTSGIQLSLLARGTLRAWH